MCHRSEMRHSLPAGLDTEYTNGCPWSAAVVKGGQDRFVQRSEEEMLELSGGTYGVVP